MLSRPQSLSMSIFTMYDWGSLASSFLTVSSTDECCSNSIIDTHPLWIWISCHSPQLMGLGITPECLTWSCGLFTSRYSAYAAPLLVPCPLPLNTSLQVACLFGTIVGVLWISELCIQMSGEFLSWAPGYMARCVYLLVAAMAVSTPAVNTMLPQFERGVGPDPDGGI